MDLLIGTVIGIFGAKSAPLRGSKIMKNGNFGHIAFFLRFQYANELHDITAHARIVRDRPKNRV